MMKKTYIAPMLEEIEAESEQALLTVSSEIGIGYGGVDEGSHDPSAPVFEIFE